MYEVFETLLKEKNVSAYRVAHDIGISPTVFSEWKSGRSAPKIDKLNKIADYFNVSTDYLLGRAENTPPKEFDFVEYLHTLTWETLTPEQKQAIVKLVYGAEVERLEKENKDKK